jgi:error-prone DNA polymerase
MNFAHLHVHSNYSFCRGANSIEEICYSAQQKGFSHIALTETNGVYGLGFFLQVARSYRLQPVIGAYLDKNSIQAVVLTKNYSGYQFLCQTITKIHCDDSLDLCAWLVQNRHDVIILSNSAELIKMTASSNRHDDFFVELIPHQGGEDAVRLSKKFNFPLAATNGAYFIDKENFQSHFMLRAIDLNTTLTRIPPQELATRNSTLNSFEEMQDLIPNHPEALYNTTKIAAQCTFDLDFERLIFPEYVAPNGEDTNSFLWHKVRSGISWRYEKITKEIEARLEYEMDIIINKGFAPYFLVVADIVEKAPRTCGRGSAAASLVSYSLGITHVDPIKYDLFFERFLNPGREDPPDIDVDFPWDERDDILDYIFKKYGRGSVAMIANHNSFKSRSAVREIAKVYGLPDEEIGAITKKMTGYWQPDSIWQLTQTHPIYKEAEFPEPWPEIIKLAESIRGFPRHLSLHCGGVVIAPDGLDNYVPFQPAKKALKLTGILDDRSTGLPNHSRPEDLFVIQWEKDQAEDMKLIKMDILGNRSLAVIRDALYAIKVNYNIHIDYATWDPLKDSKTQSLLRRGDTIGVFYVESPAMRLLQQKTDSGDFEHLVIHSSIIRPAANSFINEYIRRLKGGQYEPLHPLLEDILKETFGIMVYQEDVSKVAMALADFSPVEADDLRKILSKKHRAKKLEYYRSQFFNGTYKNNIEEKNAAKIWEMIMSFSGYSFCKPHSASYALVSFKSAYLKAYYPAEFIAAVITNQGGYYSTFAYISEARRMGLEVLMPDVNYSEKRYIGVSKAVRVGFMQLKGLEKKAIDLILRERQRTGHFHSLDDLLFRVDLELSDLSILVKSGCLDELEPNKSRPQLLWQVRLFLLNSIDTPQGQTISLFDEAPKVATPDTGNYDASTVLQHEIQTLGFLLSKHPLALYKEKLENMQFTEGVSLKKFANKRIKMIGWYITGKVTSTKNNDLMEFLSFEDTTAIYETTFFPKIFSKFVHMISRERPYVLEGRVDVHYGAATLNVDNVEYL